MEYELTRYDEARNALAICASIDEVKDIQDKSEAMRLYAKMSENTELEIFAATIKLRAQVKLGEIIAGLGKATNQHALPTAGKSKKESLAAAKISTSTANRYEQLAAVPEKVLEKFITQSAESKKPVSMPKALALVKPLTPKPTQTLSPTPEIQPQEQPDALPGPKLETVTIPKEQYEELCAIIEENKQEWEALEKLIDGNFMIDDAIKTINGQVAIIATLKTQLAGKDNKINEQIRLIKAKDKQIKKLETEIAELKIKEIGI